MEYKQFTNSIYREYMRGWDIGPTSPMGPSPWPSWNARFHGHLHEGRPLYIHTYNPWHHLRKMSSWVGNPGRPPYVIPRGSAGLKKKERYDDV